MCYVMCEDTFERTILKLKILGSIREQDRLYSYHNSLDIGGPSKLSCLYRFFYGETRIQNIECVKDILATAFTLAHFFLSKNEYLGDYAQSRTNEISLQHKIHHTESKQKLGRLYTAMKEAREGIKNLAKTYVNDIRTVQCIESIVTTIDNNLEQLDLTKKFFKEKEGGKN